MKRNWKAYAPLCDAACSASSSHCVEADFTRGFCRTARDVNDSNHNLAEVGYNRTAIAGIIKTAENYGVRMLESDLINNQSEGSYEGVMIFRGAIAEVLDAIMDRNESALAIEERLQRLRGGKQ